MKVSNKIFTWSNFSSQLNKLIPTAKTANKKVKTLSSFSTWNPAFSQAAKKPPVKTVPILEFDLKLLKQISDEANAKNLSYQGFISSHLQHSPIDDNSKIALKKAIAIKKMVSLVNATVNDMKKIEMRAISHNKG